MWALLLGVGSAIAVIAGVVSNINDIISLPQNVSGIFNVIFHRGNTIQQHTYYFESQKGLMENKLRNYRERIIYDENNVGVQDIIEDLRNRCSLNSGGYIYFEGRRKIGKTAFASNIVNKLDACHHFVSLSEGRDDKELIIKSLIEQIYSRLKKECPSLSGEIELIALFGNALTLFSEYSIKKKECQFIVIDGIDVLESDVFDFLPDYFPNGVYLLGFCEKIVSELYYGKYFFHRLKFSEAKDLVREVGISESEIYEVYDCLEGNPSALNYFVENYSDASTLSKQLEDALFSLNTEGHFNRMSQNEMNFIILLYTAFGPISMVDIINICDKTREEIDYIIKKNKGYIASDRNGVMLIDDEIRKYIGNNNNLGFKEIEEKKQCHKKLIAYLANKNCEYSNKYLIYHYREVGNIAAIIEILSRKSKNENLNGEKRRFLNSLTEAQNDSDSNLILRGIIEKNDPVLLDLLFDSMQFIIDNKKDYQKISSILKEINNLELEDESRYMALYFGAVCKRKEGNIKEAKGELSQINMDRLREPFNILANIQLADCARETGEVIFANGLYEYITNIKDCKEEYPREFWECQLKIIDRKYCDGLYKQTIELNKTAERECNRLLLYNLLLKYYKEDAQVYNDLCMYDECINVIEIALEICKSRKNDGMRGELYNLLSIAESSINPQNGRVTARKALEINDNAGSIIEKGKSFFALGDADFREGRYSDAKTNYSKAMKLFEEAEYKSGMGRIEHEFAKVAMKESRCDQAIEHINNSNNYFVRDYGRTHRIYEYKNVILMRTIEDKQILDDDFIQCDIIEFLSDRQTFIDRYLNEVI